MDRKQYDKRILAIEKLTIEYRNKEISSEEYETGLGSIVKEIKDKSIKEGERFIAHLDRSKIIDDDEKNKIKKKAIYQGYTMGYDRRSNRTKGI